MTPRLVSENFLGSVAGYAEYRKAGASLDDVNAKAPSEAPASRRWQAGRLQEA